MIASGAKVDEETDPDAGTFTHRYVAPLMRDFAFMASAQYQVVSGQYDDIQVDVHYLANGQEGAAKALQWTLDALAAFSEGFGDYVYNDLDVVQTLTSAGGIEYPGLIVMSSDYWYSNTPWFERIMVHEVAHQWWYGMVGNNQPYFTWVDESLTDYCILYYIQATYGDEAYANLVANFQRIYSNYEAESNSIGVIGLPSAGYSPSAFLPILYRKGAVFFHTLAQLMGQDRFELALRNYLSTYRYGITGPDELQSAFEQVQGGELDALFIEWVGYSN
jgi:aminopeptidase N